MPENYNIINNVVTNGATAVSFTKLYIRHVPSKVKSNKAIILLNSRSLCVESSMGISMGTISFADYLAKNGIHAFLLDMRGFGLSSPVEEQLKTDYSQIKNQLTVEDYYSDISCAVKHIKSVIEEPKISIFGFSYAGKLVIGYSNIYPGTFENIVLLNSAWTTYEDDDTGYAIVSTADEQSSSPHVVISMDKIQNRLLNAQPKNKNFIEPLGYEEAQRELMNYHKTYDKNTNTWRVAKVKMGNDFYTKAGVLKNVTNRVLLLSSQYDIENPYYISSRLYKNRSEEHTSELQSH